MWLLTLLVTACDAGSEETCVEQDVVTTVGIDDGGTEVVLGVEEHFDFAFNESNVPWEMELVAVDAAVLDRVDTCGDESEVPTCADCPTLVHWVFEAYATGSTTLEIAKTEDGVATDTYSFAVTVE